MTYEQVLWIIENENYLNSDNKEDKKLVYGDSAPDEVKSIVDEMNGDTEQRQKVNEYKDKASLLLEQFESGNSITDWEEVTKVDINNPDDWEDVTNEQ